METGNLKTFVQKFIQAKPLQDFPHLYIVDKQTGPFRSIQEAIDAAEPNSVIKISEGFYQQNLLITKPLKLQPKNSKSGQSTGVILLASGGIALHIKLAQSQQQCDITGMKFSHSGNSDSDLKKQLMEHEHILNIFQHHQNIEQLQNQFVNRTTFNKMENIIVLIERGKAKLMKSCNATIPAIWIQKDGDLHMVLSQVKGHESKNTIGIVCRLGQMLIQSSSISSHKQGGILIWGVKANNSKIIKSFIQDCGIGVHMVGEDFRLKLLSNSIRKNNIGIKVGLASQPQISRNIICENTQGIQIYSAFPIIESNKIQKNKQNGIKIQSYKGFLCKAIIRRNIGITGNKLNGILIEGQNNRSVVQDNYMIGFNNEAGIKVEKEAFPAISGNKIYKNLKQGILVVENSNAVVQKNEVSHNLQCNIAIGGINSHHSILVENIISDSPGVGIYVIRSGQFKLIRNDIARNQDGIIIAAGMPQIRRNYISQNKNTGIVCQQHSYPLLIQNFITRNLGVGLLLRHSSGLKNSVIHSNLLVSNQIDAAMQEYNQILLKNLVNSNTVERDVYYPQQLSCNIM